MITNSTLLPPELIRLLNEVGNKLEGGDDPNPLLRNAVNMLASIDPADIARADREIADAAGLYRRYDMSLISKIYSAVRRETLLLSRFTEVEYLYIFHRDGRLREAALRKIEGGLPSPFVFAAVLWRLNDWAEPVRQAAAECARRCFPATAAIVVAQAAVEILVRQKTWRRWRQERAILDDVFGRDDVAAELADLFARGATGPQASMLRYAMRTAALDPYLVALASDAVQPSVRAVAVEALINGKAEWPSGTAWRWIDKSMGLRRRETAFDRRDLTVTCRRESLIARGIRDKSAAVRRVAVSGIIRHMLDTADARAWAETLVSDPSKAVRERAMFVLRRHGDSDD